MKDLGRSWQEGGKEDGEYHSTYDDDVCDCEGECFAWYGEGTTWEEVLNHD